MNKIIIYDFDGTLTPYPITDFKVLEEIGFVGGGNNKEFQKIVLNRMNEKQLDLYNAFYEIIFEMLECNGYKINDDTISIGADKLDYVRGIEDYFLDINNRVDNYIVSSSIKVFLEKTLISKYFNDIYATTFKYNGNNIIGLDILMNDNKKIDAIKDIVKENSYSNVIYIGDGLTDVKAFNYIKSNGGISILVSDLEDIDSELKEAITYNFKKDYSRTSELYKFINKYISE